jgi:hypothetical protein
LVAAAQKRRTQKDEETGCGGRGGRKDKKQNALHNAAGS